VSVIRPASNCAEVPFAVSRALEPPAQVALEDYARVLTNAAAAEARLTDTGAVAGVHVCGAAGGVSAAMARDVEDFAAELAATSPGGGLGWS
jgi:hypothetical protein